MSVGSPCWGWLEEGSCRAGLLPGSVRGSLWASPPALHGDAQICRELWYKRAGLDVPKV